MHPLKSYRLHSGLTQKQLADRLGVERETLARWEVGIRRIGANNLANIAQATGILPSQLRPDLAQLMSDAD